MQGAFILSRKNAVRYPVSDSEEKIETQRAAVPYRRKGKLIEKAKSAAGSIISNGPDSVGGSTRDEEGLPRTDKTVQKIDRNS